MAPEIIEKLKNLVMLYWIIIIAFSAVIIGAFIIYLVSPRENLSDILKNDVLKEIGIAFSIIGLAILFYEYFIRKNMMDIVEDFLKNNLMKLINDQCELVKSISKSVLTSGLINVYAPGKGDTEILNHAKENIKLLGITINKYFTPDGGSDFVTLKRFVENGGKLQILMLNPESPHVAYREKDEKNVKLKEQISASFEIKKQFIERLESNRSNVEIKFYDTYPLYAMTIIDDNRMLVTPYLINKKGAECPTYEYMSIEGGSFSLYLKHFNDLYELNTTINALKVKNQ